MASNKRPRSEEATFDKPAERETHRQKTTLNRWSDGNSSPRFTSTTQKPPRGPPPPAPPAVPSTAPIAPPHLGHLSAKYSTHSMTVSANSKIRAKVTHLLQSMADFDVVAASARSDAGNKLVSVVEIAKRQLQDAGRDWFQYTGCTGRLEQLKNPAAGRGNGDGGRMIANWGLGRSLESGEVEGGAPVTTTTTPVPAADGDEEMPDAVDGVDGAEETAFEQMVAPERQKVRLVPIMTVFLSGRAVPELRKLFQ